MDIVKLAKEDNKILAILVNRWQLGGKRKNPFPDVFLKSKAVFWGFLGTCGTVLVFIWISIASLSNWISHSIVITVFFLFAVILALIFWKGYGIKQKISDEKNVDEFCNAISLIEELYRIGNLRNDIWQWDKFSDSSTKIGENYLRSRATHLQELEKIPWRKEEEQKFRIQFDKEFEILTLLLLLPTDRIHYFGSRFDPLKIEVEA